MKKLCQDRVVIITGAGGGLGRSYALAFAEQGAKVALNDINLEAVTNTQKVIQERGGEAGVFMADITNYQESGKLVDDVVQLFGTLHVVVNNAGICRDKMFASMKEEDWDAVINVHLKGHFCITSHAVKYWRSAAKEGNPIQARIINTSSGAGLQGSVGQSNYAAAKGGIATLTLVQAAELGRYGITANGLAPAARTGMTEDVFASMMEKPKDGSFDYYDPANVAPLVTWLGSERSRHVTGQIFEVEGDKISISDGWRTTPGLRKGRRWNPQELDDALGKLLEAQVPAQGVYGAQPTTSARS